MSAAGASVLATGFLVVFLLFAGLVSAAGSSWGVEEIAAFGFAGFVGKGRTLFGGSIWLRLNGAAAERSRYGSGALLVGRNSFPQEVAARVVNSELGIMLVFGPS